jgi:hypothetical protein
LLRAPTSKKASARAAKMRNEESSGRPGSSSQNSNPLTVYLVNIAAFSIHEIDGHGARVGVGGDDRCAPIIREAGHGNAAPSAA